VGFFDIFRNNKEQQPSYDIKVAKSPYFLKKNKNSL